MSDFDTTEKLNVLLKSAFNVTSTNENTPWYNETVVPFNNYVEAAMFLKTYQKHRFGQHKQSIQMIMG